jgi:ferredoxin--NADP+ reductase
MSAFNTETVTHVHHWTDRLFSFRTTRNPAFRYENGQFVMIGLPVDGKPLLRAYSVVSPNYEEELEFLSIKVPNGPLTSRLQHIKVGEEIIVGRKATGTLLANNLLPGRNLYLIGTGTGLAPFMSLIRDPEVYERFEKVILVHGVREVAELAYSDQIEHEYPNHELLGEQIAGQLLYYPTVTREAFRHHGRITDLVASGQIFADLGLPVWDPAQDRAMLCGSPQMLADMVAMLEKGGFTEGNSSKPGSYVIEKAFVEK